VNDNHKTAVNFAEHRQRAFDFVAVADFAQPLIIDEKDITAAR